ncbi:hypothetical protein EHI8A_131520 [Entamoeba histolytica HM-1:IMSS-B]|uniref:Rho-GAP domain-containing protein n=6 Tax=Entamoeba histolytica TaxID=5759 RepID=B1N3U5_ENTH1|nr:hypothetical protein, conserved [Entamoeba histolytica HM-1:IMSS]EMD42984.1 Hypothetical protein EHI5A_080620 [Entamoeba histolytica KU27]EMH75949.1 hypothetical protein EHI8A_131520 [Entamoeba histolytica HM-1:IMSS-B]EMS17934.1 hypothetical protein KM1_187160 [Entamoeba histolytica HM-3:IMSS]ENY63295.1 hypothetical protein EHI7A_110150 [Entamoeba histolytica HM-1:IMSS-A]GAT96645.1 hypothetical protein conserved [Entamoeba histolytica]|eukprot:XP_001913860.1 hypothetical protein, conserved [Entamoeba histolytica HM-1:IMSS]
MKSDIHKKIDITQNKKFASDMYCFSSIITSFLKDLPSPIFSYSDRNMFLSAISQFKEINDLPKTVTALTLAIRRIDPIKRRYLIFMLNLYYSITQQQEINKMDFNKLSICVAPSFFSQEITYMITTEKNIQSEIQIMTLLIGLYPLICSGFEESKNVLEQKYNLTPQQLSDYMKNPSSYLIKGIKFNTSKQPSNSSVSLRRTKSMA